MISALLAAFAAVISGGVSADGVAFANGRYPIGPVIELEISPSQAALIDLFRTCRQPNTFTPYVFHLSTSQRKILEREAGFAPSRFAVVDGYRGADGDELKVNVVNRFAERKIEILRSALLQDSYARKWETEVMGWKASPFAKFTPAQVEAGQCPK